MFVDLRQALKPGETVKGTLAFEKAGTVEIEYRIGGIGRRPPPPRPARTSITEAACSFSGLSVGPHGPWWPWRSSSGPDRGRLVPDGMARPVPTRDDQGMPAVGGPFSLVNHRGERITQATFKGKPTAYSLGFTHCPEVCPTTLFGMTQHLKELGPTPTASTSCS